jgi:AbrB family looped-hinge helix DNA binding protein
MTRTTLRQKGQITLPAEIRDALHIEDGDEIEFELTPDGRVLMSALKMIPAEQAWFWTESWQEGEREASAQLAGGESQVFQTSEDFLRSLDD